LCYITLAGHLVFVMCIPFDELYYIVKK